MEVFACFLASQVLDLAWLLLAALEVFPCPLLWPSPALVAHLLQHPAQLAVAAVKHNTNVAADEPAFNSPSR